MKDQKLIDAIKNVSSGNCGCGASKDEIALVVHAANSTIELLEALRLADAALSGANMNMDVVEKKVKSAIDKARG